jgi:hypothetical protein
MRKRDGQLIATSYDDLNRRTAALVICAIRRLIEETPVVIAPEPTSRVDERENC